MHWLSRLTGLTFAEFAGSSFPVGSPGRLTLETGGLRSLALGGPAVVGAVRVGQGSILAEGPLRSVIKISPVFTTFTDEKTEAW